MKKHHFSRKNKNKYHKTTFSFVLLVKGADKKMENLSFRPSDEEIEKTVNTYSNMLFRLCFTALKNREDAKDAVSTVFLKYISYKKPFENNEHKKAWLIRVASNECKNTLRFNKAHAHCDIDENVPSCRNDGEKEAINILFSLKEKYRTVMYLYYVEGYRTEEIAEILSLSASCVRKRLQYGREKLKIEYERGML